MSFSVGNFIKRDLLALFGAPVSAFAPEKFIFKLKSESAVKAMNTFILFIMFAVGSVYGVSVSFSFSFLLLCGDTFFLL